MRRWPAALFAASSLGCAAPGYGPLDSATFLHPTAPSGYRDTSLGDGVYEITTRVSGGDLKDAIAYFDRRRGEIQQEQGYATCDTLYVAELREDPKTRIVPTYLSPVTPGAQARGHIKCVRIPARAAPPANVPGE
jgi:hypothetical protein